jgi:hypothetical protein
MNLRLFVLLVTIPLLGTGCATLTKGSNQTIIVATDPSGAVCELSRDGKKVAVINPTPGSIPVSVRETHLDGWQMGGDDRVMDATGTCPRLRSWTQQHDRSLGMRTAAGISAIR